MYIQEKKTKSVKKVHMDFADLAPPSFIVDYLTFHFRKETYKKDLIALIKHYYPDLRETGVIRPYFTNKGHKDDSNKMPYVHVVTVYAKEQYVHYYLSFPGIFATDLLNVIFSDSYGSHIRKECTITRIDLDLSSLEWKKMIGWKTLKIWLIIFIRSSRKDVD